ncbi:hypothetical protein, partial [Oscillibacter valericigenes]|uniref:hypothetical protein n=1 Tax=Oscillibacter valericigenes TaxID=351091 RepID=UPI001F16ACFD
KMHLNLIVRFFFFQLARFTSYRNAPLYEFETVSVKVCNRKAVHFQGSCFFTQGIVKRFHDLRLWISVLRHFIASSLPAGNLRAVFLAYF